jgi:hypothetical protein
MSKQRRKAIKVNGKVQMTGGDENFLLNLARQLRRQGHDADVVDVYRIETVEEVTDE